MVSCTDEDVFECFMRSKRYRRRGGTVATITGEAKRLKKLLEYIARSRLLGVYELLSSAEIASLETVSVHLYTMFVIRNMPPKDVGFH